MKWKYIKWFILLAIIVLIAITSYRYYGSIDWSKIHSNRISELPIIKDSDDTGEFRLPIGDLEFYIRAAGLQYEGPAVILLHGFPESSIMWTELLSKGAGSGYRVIAFDQRGYSPGARPRGKENYKIKELTGETDEVEEEEPEELEETSDVPKRGGLMGGEE